MTLPRNESVFNSRRALLQAAGGCGLMTNTSLMATLLNLQATKSLMAAETNPTGYKAIVCLFLLGGNDSYNMLAPYDGTATSGEYGNYVSVRGGIHDPENNPGGLALDQSTLVPILGPDSRNFGLHPGMASQAYDDPQPDPLPDPSTTGVAGLYNTGKLSFVANVGSLVEPTTRAQYNARAGLPLGLFSHADLQRHWQTGFPQSRSQITGWGGRMADLLQSTNSNPTVSMNISVNGMNLFQTGSDVIPYAIGTGGATKVNGYAGSLGRQDRMNSRAINNILDQTYNDLIAKSFAETNRNSAEAALQFNDATDAVTIDTPFANENPSNQLKMVAKVIGARQALGQTRQIFFVTNGGWDNHSGLIGAQQTNLAEVSRAIRSFYDATVELGIQNDVALFTASDFARTLGSNGQGSDHAWGGNQIVAGGSVDGGKLFGKYPTDLLNPVDSFAGSLNLGRGRLIPTTSVDEFAADLAMWFGVGNNQDLVDVIPNIRSFFSAGSTAGPLGLFV
ncbi:hypothetical protein Mal15_45790 [Stieleria maiorica]|uniref:DUF1501 domain-containing protein n=1 Tax=Stieleria maiorica TaxID=2795974 RepID=A0A5B9MHB2_9BACT|nr:DUF1501 domain-containing protein [Stieleria maiorica]QEG00509.1 hypothetical protein Mal15_45790 [Stieleria maiorica]